MTTKHEKDFKDALNPGGNYPGTTAITGDVVVLCVLFVPGPQVKSAAFNEEGGGQNAHGKEARAVVDWIAGAQASPEVALRV
jgi:hypothetical protein